MLKITKSQKAFTLIELLVVMAIIAILSAIMFGPIQTARRRSKDTQAVADMKLLQNYLTLWGDDHNGKYPNSLSELSIYGSIPTSRINTSSTADYSKYNYSRFKYGTSGTTILGYHLWTHLNDANPAFDSDADCDEGGEGTDLCFFTIGYTYYTTQDATLDINGYYLYDNSSASTPPSASVCKDDKHCILDYSSVR